MDEYMNYQQPEDPGVSHASRVAWGIGLATCGITAVSQLAAGATFSWKLIAMILGTGIGVGGLAFAVVYTCIKLGPILYPEFMYRAKQVDNLRAEMGEVRSRLFYEAIREPLPGTPDPAVEVTGDEVTDHLSRYLSDGYFRVGATRYPLPTGIDPSWLETIARHRWAGKLFTVSTRSLDDIGISRFGNGDSPASVTIQFLERTGVITNQGERQPYKWTGAGARIFPVSPTPPYQG